MADPMQVGDFDDPQTEKSTELENAGTANVDSWGRDRQTLKWLAGLIIFIALAVQLTRICQVVSKDGDVPFLSANDRSRWCTIEALVNTHSFEIDHLIFEDDQQRKRSSWYSIDLVRHRGTDGELHYYSSKPALLPILYAGVYWCVGLVTGQDLIGEPFLVARIILVLVNLLPYGFFLWFLMRWLSHQSSDDGWSYLVWACFVAWGTFLSTFVVTLNNHLPAAIAVGVSVWCLDRILVRGDDRTRWFAVCGLCTSFGAANELPALGWVVAAGCALLVCKPVKTIVAYVPSLLPITLAFFGLNYLAHDDWRPPYAHRDAGSLIFELPIEAGTTNLETSAIVDALNQNGVACSEDCQIRQARRENTFELLDRKNSMQYALRVAEDSSKVSVLSWDDWYDFPGAYWAGEKSGVDKGEPDRAKYIAHCLVGHHGIFSLTPFWLVSIVGVFYAFKNRTTINFLKDRRLLLTLVMLGTTVIVVGFYFARGLEDRNYGGVTSGFRWTFWLIPLWLWLAKDVLVAIRAPAIRRAVEMLVVLSAFSACYPWKNPWTTPWPMQLCEYMGWV